MQNDLALHALLHTNYCFFVLALEHENAFSVYSSQNAVPFCALVNRNYFKTDESLEFS